jgi:argininosuccinate lyase
VWCQVNDKDFDGLTDEELAKVSPHLTPDVREVLNVPGALASRKAYGGTAPDRVQEQLTALRAAVDTQATWAADS